MSDTMAISSRYEFSAEDTLMSRSPIPFTNSDFVEKPDTNSQVMLLVCSLITLMGKSEKKWSAKNMKGRDL